MLASSLDEFPRRDHSPGVFFYTRSSDPSRSMLRIRLDERVEEHTRSFDVTYFCFGLVHDAVEVGKITLGVDRRCGARMIPRDLVELQRKHFVTGLTDFDEVSQRARVCWCFEPVILDAQVGRPYVSTR